jgi:hypothetical protein
VLGKNLVGCVGVFGVSGQGCSSQQISAIAGRVMATVGFEEPAPYHFSFAKISLLVLSDEFSFIGFIV